MAKADTDDLTLHRGAMADLAVDLWRIQKRIQRNGDTSSPVGLACDTAMDRLSYLGFRISDLVGQAYDENMLVHEVHREGGSFNLRISECLSPAVYFRDQLIKRAEVVTKGDAEDEDANR